MQKKINIITCNKWKDLDPSDALLATKLESKGFEIKAVPWNIGDKNSFNYNDIILLRSNWDYHLYKNDFLSWLDYLDEIKCRVFNSTNLIRWNLEKTYLIELQEKGIRIPKTIFTENLNVEDLKSFLSENKLSKAVVKPICCASGHGVTLIDKKTLSYNTVLAGDQTSIVQEFIPEISSGEISMVYFDGEFSHSFLKTPKKGEFRVNSQYGGEVEKIKHTENKFIEFGKKVLSLISELPLYARIDIVIKNEEPILMELELNEPWLGLNLSDSSVKIFADCLIDRLYKKT